LLLFLRNPTRWPSEIGETPTEQTSNNSNNNKENEAAVGSRSVQRGSPSKQGPIFRRGVAGLRMADRFLAAKSMT